jgi:hypothetical protein
MKRKNDNTFNINRLLSIYTSINSSLGLGAIEHVDNETIADVILINLAKYIDKYESVTI